MWTSSNQFQEFSDEQLATLLPESNTGVTMLNSILMGAKTLRFSGEEIFFGNAKTTYIQ
jgi:hypothetical protein